MKGTKEFIKEHVEDADVFKVALNYQGIVLQVNFNHIGLNNRFEKGYKKKK